MAHLIVAIHRQTTVVDRGIQATGEFQKGLPSHSYSFGPLPDEEDEERVAVPNSRLHYHTGGLYWVALRTTRSGGTRPIFRVAAVGGRWVEEGLTLTTARREASKLGPLTAEMVYSRIVHHPCTDLIRLAAEGPVGVQEPRLEVVLGPPPAVPAGPTSQLSMFGGD